MRRSRKCACCAKDDARTLSHSWLVLWAAIRRTCAQSRWKIGSASIGLGSKSAMSGCCLVSADAQVRVRVPTHGGVQARIVRALGLGSAGGGGEGAALDVLCRKPPGGSEGLADFRSEAGAPSSDSGEYWCHGLALGLEWPPSREHLHTTCTASFCRPSASARTDLGAFPERSSLQTSGRSLLRPRGRCFEGAKGVLGQAVKTTSPLVIKTHTCICSVRHFSASMFHSDAACALAPM